MCDFIEVQGRCVSSLRSSSVLCVEGVNVRVFCVLSIEVWVFCLSSLRSSSRVCVEGIKVRGLCVSSLSCTSRFCVKCSQARVFYVLPVEVRLLSVVCRGFDVSPIVFRACLPCPSPCV